MAARDDLAQAVFAAFADEAPGTWQVGQAAPLPCQVIFQQQAAAGRFVAGVGRAVSVLRAEVGEYERGALIRARGQLFKVTDKLADDGTLLQVSVVEVVGS